MVGIKKISSEALSIATRYNGWQPRLVFYTKDLGKSQNSKGENWISIAAPKMLLVVLWKKENVELRKEFTSLWQKMLYDVNKRWSCENALNVGGREAGKSKDNERKDVSPQKILNKIKNMIYGKNLQ